MGLTRVVNRHVEGYDVYIGRPSKWGNPYSHLTGTQAKFKVATRKEAVDKYRQWIIHNPTLMNQLHELKDKVLGCSCKPRSCHGDILVELIEDERRKLFV